MITMEEQDNLVSSNKMVKRGSDDSKHAQAGTGSGEDIGVCKE